MQAGDARMNEHLLWKWLGFDALTVAVTAPQGNVVHTHGRHL